MDSPDSPTSVAGLGVDIIEIDRMRQAFERVPTMRDRLFTPAEVAYAESKARPIAHYALFFAAKEAVLKALGTGFTGMGWTDVEVRHNERGRPYPHLEGGAAAAADSQGVVAIELSLSYTHQVGVASAVAIRRQDQPRRDERADPKADLMRQFKELRSLIDELEAGEEGGPPGDGDGSADGAEAPADGDTPPADDAVASADGADDYLDKNTGGDAAGPAADCTTPALGGDAAAQPMDAGTEDDGTADDSA